MQILKNACYHFYQLDLISSIFRVKKYKFYRHSFIRWQLNIAMNFKLAIFQIILYLSFDAAKSAATFHRITTKGEVQQADLDTLVLVNVVSKLSLK